MRKLLFVLTLTVSFAAAAYAGYDIDYKNIYDDVDTMTVNEVGANDYVQVYRVENTLNGAGVSEKIPLQHLVNPTQDLTAVNTLTSADCGKTLLLTAATEFATTLPAPTAGCKLRFVVKAAPASASYTVVTASSANILIGGVNELEVDTTEDGPYDADGDTITFVDAVSAVGDFVELISDGTSWYLHGQANADGGITITKAS